MYVYNLGDGYDTILEAGTGSGNDADEIRFGAGITLNDLSFTRVGNTDMVIGINVAGSEGQIVI